MEMGAVLMMNNSGDGKGTASGNDWRYRWREGALFGEGWGLGTPWEDEWTSGKGNASGEQMMDRTGKEL